MRVADHCLAVADLWVMSDDDDHAVAFMGLTDNSIDSLFVSPAHAGKGIGRQLVEHARSLAGPLMVDVNEQNLPAVGFYGRLGFRVTGQSERDNDGRPHPLLHMAMV
ncbi:acetyltransferase GNAT family protein [Asticcacaulis biprosthecium C19]|uniref:Acetyltransferase GNAT family protein n=1 Tax=Asticcacaulis biprosthecium C19 TaxID=715226 RepID=F4QS42_9CAUL|nr:GNAT family N-acetyltransferase [Asticcacaulis biprosthecium]EGF89562.1 acetyltransferase GNAT family protein [Asticcacaulis biprosthecium C19]